MIITEICKTELINLYEKGELAFDSEHDYDQIDYVDGSELFVVHQVEGSECSLYFEEKEEVRELKLKIKQADTQAEHDRLEEELIYMIGNELADQFDYDKVVAIKLEGCPIDWL